MGDDEFNYWYLDIGKSAKPVSNKSETDTWQNKLRSKVTSSVLNKPNTNGMDSGLASSYGNMSAPGYTADRVFDSQRNMYTSKYTPNQSKQLLIQDTNGPLPFGGAAETTADARSMLGLPDVPTPEIDTPWYKDETTVGGLLGMGQLGLGLMSFLEAKKTGKVQRDALKQNVAQAKEDHDHVMSVRNSWTTPRSTV